jgi:hypothetical protein
MPEHDFIDVFLIDHKFLYESLKGASIAKREIYCVALFAVIASMQHFWRHLGSACDRKRRIPCHFLADSEACYNFVITQRSDQTVASL